MGVHWCNPAKEEASAPKAPRERKRRDPVKPKENSSTEDNEQDEPEIKPNQISYTDYRLQLTEDELGPKKDPAMLDTNLDNELSVYLGHVIRTQKIVRGFLARVRFKRDIATVVYIQALFRRNLGSVAVNEIHCIRIQALFRCVNACKEAKMRSIQIVKRARIMQEIRETEEKYVQRLLLIQKLYLDPLKKDKTYKKKYGVSEDALKEIFPATLQIITDFHSAVLLTNLLERCENWNPWSTVGDCFSKEFSGFLNVYTTYINNYDAGLKRLVVLKETLPKFKAFLDKCTADPEAKRLDLQSLLIEPIQRVPRYKLLLEDMLKKTSTFHTDYALLTEACGNVSKVASMINNRKAQYEDKHKVVEIYSEIVPPQEYLVSPSRYHVHSGILKELDVYDARMEGFYFYLFNDLLIKTKHSKVFKSKKYRERWILSDIEFSEDISDVLPPGKHVHNAFVLRVANSATCIVLMAKTNEDYNAWVKHLEEASQKLGEIRKSRTVYLATSNSESFS